MESAIVSAELLQHAGLMHLPLILFVLCPVFIVVGTALSPGRARSWLRGGLLLLGAGTATLFLR